MFRKNVFNRIVVLLVSIVSLGLAVNVQAAEKSSVDLDALLKEDYSSLVGTWENQKGDKITIAADGSN